MANCHPSPSACPELVEGRSSAVPFVFIRVIRGLAFAVLRGLCVLLFNAVNPRFL